MSDYCIENDGAGRAELAAINSDKAAAKITEQAAEIDRLREALRWIDKRCPKNTALSMIDRVTSLSAEAMHDAGECARKTLEAKS